MKSLRQAVGSALGVVGSAHSVPSAPATAAIFEKLEKRELLSASAAHRPLAKLDSTLTYTYQDYLQSGVGGSDIVPVQTYANLGDKTLLIAALKKLHATGLSVSGREVDTQMPVYELGKLANLGSLRFAASSSYVVDTGSVTSQGDSADLANTARAAYNISGAGVTIGIISDSFDNLLSNVGNSNPPPDPVSAEQGTNDLPPLGQLNDLSDNVPGTDEGRAMAQVIYDSAPGATIDFETGAGGPAAMANSIKSLAAAGCKVIVDDISYTYEPFFEDGTIAAAVESVIAQGVTYISAAGNQGQQSYASSWRTGKTYTNGQIPRDPNALNAPSQIYAGTSFNFNTTGGVTDMQPFTLGPGKLINLSFQWDSAYASLQGSSGCTNQVDVYVLNAAGTMIEGGGTALTVGKDPTQTVNFSNPSTTTSASYNLLIVSENGYATPGYIKYVDFAGQTTTSTFYNGASTIVGHDNAAGVIAVGAVNYANTPVYNGGSSSKLALESYSSSGGTPIFFNSSGGRLSTQINRQEPVVDGPDDVSNTFFGTQTSSSPPTYTFGGTSASAAGVAGVVALIAGINPSLTPANISAILAQTSLAIGTIPNNQSGYGLVQTYPAIQAAVGDVSGTVYSDNNANSVFDSGEPGIKGVTVYLDINDIGHFVTGDPFVTTAANGTFRFYNQPSGATILRAIQPPGFIATSGSRAITILGNTLISGLTLGFFPDNFNASNANYTVQLDTASPPNVDIYVGSTLTYYAPLSFVPSFSFNFGGANNLLTINYVNGDPIPSGGITYNGINGSTGNSLVMNGTSANDTVDFNNSVTTFDGSEVATSDIQSEIINGNSGNDTFSISGAEPATETLTFNGGVGNDSLTVNDILPNNGVGTTFNAGTGSTDQNTLTVNEGTFTFPGDPAAHSSNLAINLGSTPSVDINGNPVTLFSTVVIPAGALGSGINQRTIASLNISNGCLAEVAAPASHNDRVVLITNSISIAAGGMLDLSGNDMIVTGGGIANVNALLSTGINNGNWNGSGIQSTAAATDTTFLTALGSLLNNASGTPLYGSGTQLGLFDGISPAPGAVLVKYTYYGDTNLDGKVDGTDYARTDNGYLHQLTGWANGDFNYDNVINGSDYTLLDNAFNTQGSKL